MDLYNTEPQSNYQSLLSMATYGFDTDTPNALINVSDGSGVSSGFNIGINGIGWEKWINAKYIASSDVATPDANSSNLHYLATEKFAYKDSSATVWTIATEEYVNTVVSANMLPSQTGNAGKYLTTDGVDPSWGAINALPDQTGNNGKVITTDGTDASWATVQSVLGYTPISNVLASGNILVGSAGAVATSRAMSGDVTISNTGVTAIGAGKVTNSMLQNSSITLNGASISLGGTRILALASSDFVNQGTATTVLHGNASGNPTWGKVALATDISGILGSTNGGTGVNNGSSTITIGGNVNFVGAHTFTGNITGNTSVLFPTTGTLATLAGTETFTNKSGNISMWTNDSGYLTTIAGIAAGGELSGTYPNPTLLNSAVIGKVLTGLNVTGSTIVATDTILQAFGKTQSMINGLLGGAIYQGTWAASTNTPTLADGVGTKGYYYVASDGGTVNFGAGAIVFNTGDWAIYNGTIWQKVDNTDAVTSVNGYIGAVNLTTADIPEVTNLYYTNARGIGSTLTGYSSGAGTVSSSDSILQAIQKLNGNTAAITSSQWTTDANGITYSGGNVGIGAASSATYKLSVNGDLSVGANTVYSRYAVIGETVTGASSISPLQISESDAGMSMFSSNMASNAETYISSFLKTNAGGWRKIGAIAWQFTDRSSGSGYASVNCHVTDIAGTPSPDKFIWAGWAGRGMSIFPADLTAADAPGVNVFKVNGSVVVTTTSEFQGNATFDESGIYSKSDDGIYQAILVRNANAGTSAVARLKIGNDTNASTFTIDVYGANTAAPNYVKILNQLNAPIQMGTSGVETLTLLNGQMTLGVIGSLAGSTVYNGSTSGAVTVTGAAATTSYTITLPSTGGTNGYTLTTNGFGTTSWSALTPAGGGTGITSFTVGDILYADTTTSLAKRAVGASGTVLIGGTTPTYSAAPVLTTSLTVPSIYGGSAVGSTLTIKGTSNGSPSGDSVSIYAGATEAIKASLTSFETIVVKGSAGGGLKLGNYNSTFGGFWSAAVTPATTNYALIANATRTAFNAVTDLQFYIGDSATMMGITTTGIGLRNQSPTELLTVGSSGSFEGIMSLAGSSSGRTIIRAGTTVSGTYTLPSAVPGASGYIMASTTGGVMSWFDLFGTSNTFATNQIISASSNGVFQALGIRNTSTGTAAVTRLNIGNNASAGSFTIECFGGNFTGGNNYVRLLNQQNAPLIMGTNGVDTFTLSNGQGTFGAAGSIAGSVVLSGSTSGTIGVTTNATATQVILGSEWLYESSNHTVSHIASSSGLGMNYFIQNTANNTASSAYFSAWNADNSYQVQLFAPGQGSAVNPYVGTISNSPFAIRTNNAEAAVFSSAGNFTLKFGFGCDAMDSVSATSSVTISNNVRGIYVTGIVIVTITMPSTPYNGQEVIVATDGAYSSITVVANSGQALAGSAGFPVAANSATWKYRLSDTSWYRIAQG